MKTINIGATVVATILVASVVSAAGGWTPPRAGTQVQVPGYNGRLTNVTVSELCYGGYVYVVTDLGGIAPRIQAPSGGAFNHTGAYVRC